MFSRTVSIASDFVSWKVRTWPIWETLNAGTPESAVPSNDQLPVSGLSKPVSRLNRVVLPAPFGPINAVMAFLGISRCSTSTALSPPNERVTLSAMMIGSTLATPGAGSPTWSPVVFTVALSGIEGQLLLVSHDALRPVDDDQHQRDADQDVAQHAGLNAGEGQDALVREAREEHREERHDQPEQHRAEHGTEDGRSATEQQDRPQEERERRQEVGRNHRGRQHDDHTTEAAQHTTEDQNLHLVGEHVLAESAHGVLVFADALDHSAPRAAHEQPHEQEYDGEKTDSEHADPQGILVVLPRAE